MGRNITNWLVSSLTGLITAALLHTKTIFSCLVKSWPVQPETSRTVLVTLTNEEIVHCESPQRFQ